MIGDHTDDAPYGYRMTVKPTHTTIRISSAIRHYRARWLTTPDRLAVSKAMEMRKFQARSESGGRASRAAS